jgi:tripartite-type tricarboxylate transporter receptor subunit TctC
MKPIWPMLISVAAMVMAWNAPAHAAYPEKPIRLLLGFPPGSSADSVARLFGHELGEELGKPMVVDNVTGAAGNIAAERVAKAAADGYTLGILGEGQLVINPSLYRLAYDPIRDFAPVSQVAQSPNMLVVHNAVPANSLPELIALAKARPGELTFASGGSGSAPHMAAVLFNSVASLDIRHIPYKGVVAAIPDLLAGRVTMMLSPIAIVLPHVRDGRLRALAVTSRKRSAAVPDLPTVAESGFPGFEYTVWYGLLAPAGTAPAIIAKLNMATIKALARDDLRAKLGELGLETHPGSPDEFAAFVRAEIPKWAKVIKDAGVKAD